VDRGSAQSRNRTVLPALTAITGLSVMVGVGGCSWGNRPNLDQMVQRQEQMQLQIQQLERRLNLVTPPITSDRGGRTPAGLIKSLTYRSGTSDDRLRIYWSDGKVSDLPCTKEQNTLVCG